MGGLLFCSGAAGLIYQVAWVRLLGLAFGVTIYATSTVLAAFMAGLAIGSVVGGRWADRVARPLRVYGVVELCVGVTALTTPWLFGDLQSLYAALAQTPLVATILRGVLACAVLIVPTALMGATLPLAVRGVRPLSSHAQRSGDAWTIGLLYALNTAGAIVGTLSSGFVLIGNLGLAETIGVAAMCNVVAGLGGLALSRRRRMAASEHAVHPLPAGAGTAPRLARVAAWAFAVSGAISLAYEVVWSRILAVLFDSSIYGFVLMLATVLFGIAAGGALGGLAARTSRDRLVGLVFGLVELGIGVAAVLAIAAFGSAYDQLLGLREGPPTWLMRLVRTDLRLMAVLCVMTVLPAALLMGATFPLAARLFAAGSSSLGRRLGGIYAGNVAGGIAGSLLAGFVLVPVLGAHHALLLLAAANAIVGCLVLGAVVSRMGVGLAGLCALAVLGWGAAQPPLHEIVFREHFPDQTLLAYWEGLENTVSVARDASGVQTLFTNSRGQTNDTPDLVRYHRVMGHLATLLAPSAAPRVLVVGLGAGATPGAIAQHAEAQVDVVELSGAVIAAAPMFHVANADVLQRPNVHVVVDDGRNYLLRNRLPYDVVTADVVHPYDAGATNLYSVEYFASAARALGPGGIMLQWVSPGSAFEHSLIVRTFLQAFPYSTLWLGGDLLVGSTSPLHVSRTELERRLADPSARAGLAEVGLNHAQDVLAQFRAQPATLQTYVGAGPVLTDDHPLLEYFASQNIPLDPPDLGQFHDTLSLDP